LVPTSDGSDDFVWILGPVEGSGFSVAVFEEAVDGSLQLCKRAEDAALEPLPGQLGKEAFYSVEP